jgi:hypothetical protein
MDDVSRVTAQGATILWGLQQLAFGAGRAV